MIAESTDKCQPARRRFMEPADDISDPVDRVRARLMARMFVVLGLLAICMSTILFLATDDFSSRYPIILASAILLVVAGFGARTRYWQHFGLIAILMFLVGAILIGAMRPDDQVWPVRPVICVIVAGFFLSVRNTILVATLAVLGTVLIAIIAPGYDDPQAIQRPLVMQLLFHPLVILVAHHANRMEALRVGAIREHRDELDEAQELSGVGNWSLALDGSQQDLSAQGERFLPISQLRTRGVDAIVDMVEVSHLDELREGIDELLSGKKSLLELNEIPYGSEGERGFLSLAIVASGGALPRLEGTIEEVTDEIRRSHEQDLLREQVLEARRLETLGRMAGGIAHDFNNLLMAMGAATQILDGDSHDGQLLGEMRTATHRAQKLVQQLVALAGKEGLVPTLISPAAQIRELEPIIERLVGESITLGLRGMDVSTSVLFDSTQLEQVIVNLCVNARDAMPEGGTLTVGLREHGDDGPEPTLELWIRDTGTGMDEPTKAKAFEPFFTTKGKGKGTGIGLATVEEIIRKNGGHMDVETAPGEGCTFRIFLPLANTGPRERLDDATARQPTERRCTLLFVDDEAPLRNILTSFLRSNGFAVHTADSGEQALKLFEEHEGEIDVVVSDVQMPGMMGTELVRRLRGQRPELPVVFMSGYADNTPQTDLKTSFLAKPFPLPRLLQELSKLAQTLPDGVTPRESTNT